MNYIQKMRFGGGNPDQDSDNSLDQDYMDKEFFDLEPIQKATLRKEKQLSRV